jgi:hypothetical protein
VKRKEDELKRFLPSPCRHFGYHRGNGPKDTRSFSTSSGDPVPPYRDSENIVITVYEPNEEFCEEISRDTGELKERKAKKPIEEAFNAIARQSKIAPGLPRPGNA